MSNQVKNILEENYNKIGKIINVETVLNVRSGPGISYGIIGKLYEGNEVTIVARMKQSGESLYWYKIKFNSGYGYIRSDFVDVISVEIPYNATGKIINVSSKLNVRSGPGISYNILGTLTGGAIVTIVAKTKSSGEGLDWYKINFKLGIGYVRSDFVSLTDNNGSGNQNVNIKKVFIDPGHGGSDPGASGNAIIERDIVLEISMILGNLLKSRGIQVMYSRTSNTTYVELNERAKMANKWGADLFISIHANSFITPDACGTETYTHTNGSITSKGLAQRVVDSISNTMNLYNRGVKKANFVVLRESNMAAILVETAFVSNSLDADKLKANPGGFAIAIANGIIRHISN